MLLNGDKAEQRMQLETIIEAYEEFSPFNSDEIALIEPLRAMRFVYYLAWLIRRWDDPAFPRNFPWLTGEDYWRSQISTLLSRLRFFRNPTATNADVLIGHTRRELIMKNLAGAGRYDSGI